MDAQKEEIVTKGRSKRVIATLKKRNAKRFIDPNVHGQFASGKLLACISSRPGQMGRADGYILEGKELEFYSKKIRK